MTKEHANLDLSDEIVQDTHFSHFLLIKDLKRTDKTRLLLYCLVYLTVGSFAGSLQQYKIIDFVYFLDHF